MSEAAGRDGRAGVSPSLLYNVFVVTTLLMLQPTQFPEVMVLVNKLLMVGVVLTVASAVLGFWGFWRFVSWKIKKVSFPQFVLETLFSFPKFTLYRDFKHPL